MNQSVHRAVVLSAVVAACACDGRAEEPAGQSAADPLADDAQKIRLVGHNDLQGRESLLVAVRSEAANGNWAYAGHHVFDITNEARPIPVSTWQVPADAFCDKGGRVGPHRQAETINGRLNRFEDKLAWVAYFNAGVRLVDLSGPIIHGNSATMCRSRTRCRTRWRRGRGSRFR